MSSKWLIPLFMSGATMLAQAAVADDASLSPEDGADHHAMLYADFQDQACDGGAEYIILGDTNHQDSAIQAFVASPQSLSVLQECGIEKLFLELMPVAQPYLDDLAAGRISRADFIDNSGINIHPENLEYLADMLTISGEYGVAVIASDVLEQTQDTEEHIFFINMHIQMGLLAHASVLEDSGYPDYATLMRGVATKGKILPEEAKGGIAQALYENQDHPDFEVARELFAEADRIRETATRRTDDRMLLDFIQSAKAPGERVAVMIGNGHPEDLETGIHALIGAENSRWIVLQSGGEYRGEATPDRIYDLSSGLIVPNGP